MAFQPKRFSPLRRPNAETLDQVGQRLDRVQDAFKAVVDPLSTYVGGLGTGASADIGGLSDTPALALASSASAGTSEEASRSDHRHPFPAGSDLWTRQAVTTATALSGTGNIYVAITASFDGAITLPAATTANQTIIIVDEAGIGSGDSNGASENLIHVLCAGSDTITAPGLATSRTRLLLWKRYGTITLVADGTSSWKATERRYWHVDPRAISSLAFWIDSRRGITLNSTSVSAWADLSASNADLAQGTAANQPAYGYASNAPETMVNGENYVISSDATDTMSSTATVAFTNSTMTGIGAYNYRWQSAANTGCIVKSSETTTTGFAWFPNSSAIAPNVASGDMYIRGHGTNNDWTGPYFAGVRNTQVVLDDWTIDSWALGTSASWRRMRGSPVVATSRASAALDSFTQTLTVFNGTPVLRIQCVMLFNTTLASTDLFDCEFALNETFGFQR